VQETVYYYKRGVDVGPVPDLWRQILVIVHPLRTCLDEFTQRALTVRRAERLDFGTDGCPRIYWTARCRSVMRSSIPVFMNSKSLSVEYFDDAGLGGG